ncbi:MAG TPA: TSUP family transporter [Burkholderiales bacterium]|nr:TSUP family transporter [Burkholderiales bacterium]
MLFDGATLVAVAALAMAAAVVGAVGGFGTGVILTAALTPIIGVKAVIPVLAVAGVIINSGRFWFYRESLDRRAVAIALAAALPFLVLGAWLYAVLDARSVGTVLGAVVIASVPARRILHHRSMVLGTPGLAVGAGIWGLASGLASGTGMILVSTLLGAGLTGQAVLATDALATIAFDLCKAALFHKFDLLDEPSLVAGVLIGIATIPGSAFGKWLVTRMHARLHIVFMEALILAGGAFMLWHAWK